MSLDDLEIRKHTAPIRAELDRQKEKAATFKKERDEVARALRSLRDDLLDRLADTESPGTRQTLTAQIDMASAALAKLTQ